jgi:methionyl-tRNA formyltransferase
MNGEKEVGVTLFEMAEEVDSGRIVGQKPIPVSPKDDIGTIREKGTEAMLELLQRCFPSLVSGEPILSEQDETAATYCCKWTPADARLNWENDAESILNLIRAVTYPYPGAFCFRERDKITIWSASPPTATRVYASHAPGALTFRANDGSIGVLTGKGEIVLRELSLNDGPRLPAGDILKSLSTRLY